MLTTTSNKILALTALAGTIGVREPECRAGDLTQRLVSSSNRDNGSLTTPKPLSLTFTNGISCSAVNPFIQVDQIEGTTNAALVRFTYPNRGTLQLKISSASETPVTVRQVVVKEDGRIMDVIAPRVFSSFGIINCTPVTPQEPSGGKYQSTIVFQGTAGSVMLNLIPVARSINSAGYSSSGIRVEGPVVNDPNVQIGNVKIGQ
jgi:hypothetical protein